MISEGSCDTDDWSNDAHFDHGNKLHFTIYSQREQQFQIVKIFKNVFYIFDQIYAAFVSRWDFFQKH